MEELEAITIPLGGRRGEGLYTIVDGDYDGEWFSTIKWYLNNHGYVQGKLDGKTVALHKLVCGSKKGLVVDHINRNKLDNRSCNLRFVTHRDNLLNSDRSDNVLTRDKGATRKTTRISTPESKRKKSIYDKKRYLLIREHKLRQQRERYHKMKTLQN